MFIHLPLISLGVCAIYDIFLKKKISICKYALILFLSTSTIYLFSEQRKNVFDNTQNTQKQRETWFNLAVEHAHQGYNHLNEAEGRCWYIPVVSQREATIAAFAACLNTIKDSSIKSKGITFLITTIVSYGIAVYDEWEEISMHLTKSQYHFEMSEFYQDLLFRSQ